jgi:hypothetical protein
MRLYIGSVRDALDPLAAYRREHEQEIAILQLGNREREIFEEAQRRANELTSRGVVILNEHALALLTDANANRQAAEASRLRAEAEDAARREAAIFNPDPQPIREQILGDTFGADARRNATIAEANTLFAQGAIDVQEWRAAVQAAELAAARASRTFDSGLVRAIIDLNREYTDAASQIEQITVTTFRGAEDAIVSFITRTQFDFHQFIDALLADVARFAAQQLILAPITGGIGNLLGIQGFGGIIPNAHGNAYPHGVRMLAQGDIITKPTLAAISELGHPEGVFPLGRTSGGDLGVKAILPPAPRMPNFGGTRDIHVHISDVRQEFTAPAGMTPADFAKAAPQFSQQGFTRIIEEAVNEVIIRQQRPGGTLNRQLVVN